MSDLFFDRPIINSPYEYPRQHWELDDSGQPTGTLIPARRRAKFLVPIPKPKKRRAEQKELLYEDAAGLSTEAQAYDPTPIINELRVRVDRWRELRDPRDWRVSPTTTRLLQHWRNHEFASLRPFFCQIEAVEVAIWLTEVAPEIGREGRIFLEHLANANEGANPDLSRLALKLATGAGKTTAMLIAWQTIADLHMAEDLKNTGQGNLFVIFGEPDLDILDADNDQIQVRVNGVDVFDPSSGEVRSDGPDGIACWFIDTDYNEESFFVRHAYFLGASDPYKSLKTTLKAEIDEDAWSTLNSDTSRPFDRPKAGRIAVKVINHLGDEVMKVFRLQVSG